MYRHVGWREVDGRWAYLTADGAIDAVGRREDITVRLDGGMARFRLPAPPDGDDLRAAVRASLELAVDGHAVAPARVVVPGLGATRSSRLLQAFGSMDALRRAYAAMGVRGFWKRWLAMDIRLSPVPNTMRMASLHALAGDTAQALDWLERALAERNPGLIYVRREPSLAPLHESPRYQRVVRAMRFPG